MSIGDHTMAASQDINLSDDFRLDSKEWESRVDDRNVGIFACQDWLKRDAGYKGSDGVIDLKQEFRGPAAGVSLSF